MPVHARLPAPAVTPRHVLYLHGFASSPQGTKVGYFGDRLLEHGITVRCPDLNQPDFATMTLTRMLEQLGGELAALGGEPATLIGSSLGGTLAILGAVKFRPQVERLILLAPAVMFAKPGHHLLPPERVAEWQRRGSLPFFHYGAGVERDLNFAFYEDSLQYDAFNARFEQPTMIFQGVHDVSVDSRTVEAFAGARTNVTLSLLEDDHQLIASLPRIWNDVQPFLGLTE